MPLYACFYAVSMQYCLSNCIYWGSLFATLAFVPLACLLQALLEPAYGVVAHKVQDYIFEKAYVRVNTVNDDLLAPPARTVPFVLTRNDNFYEFAVVLGKIRVKARIAGIAPRIGFLGFVYTFHHIVRYGFNLFYFHTVHLTQYPFCRRAV